MRRLRAILLTAVLVTAPLASPAHAGGWAVTVMDPLPERLEPGRTYTVGFWVLQHGTHPFTSDLGETGLKLVAKDGKATVFKGVALREPAHFATAVTMPSKGRWTVYGVQGVFGDDEVGTLTLPGGLAVTPRPPAHTNGLVQHDPWGQIRPPYFVGRPAADGGGVLGEGASPSIVVTQPPARTAPAAETTKSGSSRLPLVILAGVAIAGLGALSFARRRPPVTKEH